jgi:hypothetical protein
MRVSQSAKRAALLLLVLATAAPASAGAATSPFGSSSFCALTEPVRDFGLSKLPPLRGIPESGDLPFGPKTVSLGVFEGPVLPVGASFGFELHSENIGGRTPLHWTVTARLYRVNLKGESVRKVGERRLRIRTIGAGDERDFHLGPFPRAGFYRYDFEILDEDGKKLGAFGQYVKAFENFYWKARLSLARDVFSPGQRVLARIENLGTETVSYGEPLHVQQLEGGSWISRSELAPGPWRMWLGLLAPGRTGRCNRLYLPEDLLPGRYRVLKSVGSGRGSADRSFRQLAAPFDVVAPEAP